MQQLLNHSGLRLLIGLIELLASPLVLVSYSLRARNATAEARRRIARTVLTPASASTAQETLDFSARAL
jgi:hypothetical protein